MGQPKSAVEGRACKHWIETQVLCGDLATNVLHWRSEDESADPYRTTTRKAAAKLELISQDGLNNDWQGRRSALTFSP